MSQYTYKTKDGTQTGFVTGFGAIINGQISSDIPIESPNLELVNGESEQTAPVEAIASQQNPEQPENAGETEQPNEQGLQLG